MRILFDQGVPAPLRRALTRHAVYTAFEMGWAQLDNGALLKAADENFDVFVTTDRNLRFQRSLGAYRLAVLVLPTTSWPRIRAHEAKITAIVDALRPGEIVELNLA